MRRRAWFFYCLGFVALAVALAAPIAAQEEKPESEQEKKSEQDSAKKEKKKKKKKQIGSESVADEKTRRIVSRVVREFNSNIEGQSTFTIRQVVDDKNFFDYPRFEEELERLFRSVGELRIYTRRVNVQTNDDRAIAVVEVDLAFVDRLDPTRRTRRRQRITFDFHRTPRGWKITEIKPREFFFLD